MNLTIQSIDFDASADLQSFIHEKAGKLVKLYDRIVDIQVILKLEKDDQNGNKVVEIKVNVPQNQLFAKHQGKTFEEGVDQCTGQVSRQVKRHKEKQRS